MWRHQIISLPREAIMTLAPSDRTQDGPKLTGRGVFLILVVFFGIVFAVNFYMARVAYGTFSGETTDAPYTEGVDYNRALEASRKQDALGWTVNIKLEPAADGMSHITLTQADRAQVHADQLTAKVHFLHPSDRGLDQTLTLSSDGQGLYHGDVHLARGHWGVELSLLQGSNLMFRSENQIDIAGVK
jgi:nitrogen fixation protein FixH